MIEHILPYGLDVLVVDDNSPDGTGQLADRLHVEKGSRVDVLHRTCKQGLGPAYVAGFKAALGAGYDPILQMDCDFSHNPFYLPDFLNAIQSADIVLGSRYVRGGGTVKWGMARRALSRFGSVYAGLLLSLPYPDLTSGFKCFRREALERLDLDDTLANGYAFNIELTYRAHQLGLKITQVPIVFNNRQIGNSKMSASIILEAMLVVWQLKKSAIRLTKA